MAIIIEEEKKNGNIIRIVEWLGVFLILAAAAYYVFFANPDIIAVVPTGNLSIITPIANITLHPQDVQSAVQGFQSAVTLPTPTGPAAVGRTNPFVAP